MIKENIKLFYEFSINNFFNIFSRFNEHFLGVHFSMIKFTNVIKVIKLSTSWHEKYEIDLKNKLIKKK